MPDEFQIPDHPADCGEEMCSTCQAWLEILIMARHDPPAQAALRIHTSTNLNLAPTFALVLAWLKITATEIAKLNRSNGRRSPWSP